MTEYPTDLRSVVENLAETRDALRASQARFESIVAGSPQGIIIQQESRIVYANPAMASLFGYAGPEEMLGLDPFLDLIAEQDIDLFRERTARVYRGGTVEPTGGWRARRKDGRTVWISSTAHLSEWKGRPAVTSFYLDITERKNVELALRESDALYRAALTAGRMGAWDTDLVARTRNWTGEGMALFGLDLPDGRGQVGGESDEYMAAIHPDDRHLVADFYRLADEQDCFDAEYRVVRPDGGVLWLSGRGQVVARQPDGRAHRIISVMADITERKTKELHVQFLLREITHRSRNLLTVIQSLARQTARNTGNFESFHEGFARRLQGLAASHEVLIRGTWRGAAMRDLVQEHLAPFTEEGCSGIEVIGPDISLEPDAAQAIGLAIHELATNAVKYGALSVPAGRVIVSWRLEPESEPLAVRFAWTEHGGPKVVPPKRTGFGHIVLREVVATALSGKVALDFREPGVTWMVTFPASLLK